MQRKVIGMRDGEISHMASPSTAPDAYRIRHLMEACWSSQHHRAPWNILQESKRHGPSHGASQRQVWGMRRAVQQSWQIIAGDVFFSFSKHSPDTALGTPACSFIHLLSSRPPAHSQFGNRKLIVGKQCLSARGAVMSASGGESVHGNEGWTRIGGDSNWDANWPLRANAESEFLDSSENEYLHVVACTRETRMFEWQGVWRMRGVYSVRWSPLPLRATSGNVWRLRQF